MIGSYIREWSLWLFITWLALIVVVVFGKPPNTPPSAPAGCGIVNGFPVYAYPPVNYEDRFSVGAVGPTPHGRHCQCVDCFPYTAASDNLGDWAWADAVQSGHCPTSRAAVTAQGVGE